MKNYKLSPLFYSGKGLVKGSLTLISGEPGIGKSTLIMQVAANIAEKYGSVLYVSGEESEEQIKMRADRICPSISDNLFVLAETDMENIYVACENIKPGFLIIDSIQTMYTRELESAPGSVSQVRACSGMLMRMTPLRLHDVPGLLPLPGRGAPDRGVRGGGAVRPGPRGPLRQRPRTVRPGPARVFCFAIIS